MSLRTAQQYVRVGLDVHDTTTDNETATQELIAEERLRLQADLSDEAIQAIRDRIHTDDHLILNRVKPIPGSIESVHQIISFGADVHFVSRSDEDAHCASFRWLTQYGLGHLPHQHTGRGRLKHLVLHPGQFHVFLENNPVEAKMLCRIIPYVFLLELSLSDDRPEPIPLLTPWGDAPIIIPGFACFTACVRVIIEQLDGMEEEIFVQRRPRRSSRKSSTSSDRIPSQPARKSRPGLSTTRPRRSTKLAS